MRLISNLSSGFLSNLRDNWWKIFCVNIYCGEGCLELSSSRSFKKSFSVNKTVLLSSWSFYYFSLDRFLVNISLILLLSLTAAPPLPPPCRRTITSSNLTSPSIKESIKSFLLAVLAFGRPTPPLLSSKPFAAWNFFRSLANSLWKNRSSCICYIVLSSCSLSTSSKKFSSNVINSLCLFVTCFLLLLFTAEELFELFWCATIIDDGFTFLDLEV